MADGTQARDPNLRLLALCAYVYLDGRREGWEDGPSQGECIERIGDELDNIFGPSADRVEVLGAWLDEHRDEILSAAPLRLDTSEWKRAALQARDDLKRIEEQCLAGEPPISDGQIWDRWGSPANTIRWIDRLEHKHPTPAEEDS